MRYFECVAVGDRVWDFIHKWGTVESVHHTYITVRFDDESNLSYNFEGVQNNTNLSQTLFWDKIKFEKPKKNRIKLKESKFIIDPAHKAREACKYSRSFAEPMQFRGFARDDLKTAVTAFREIIKHARLLALRDELCEESRGFIPDESQSYFIIIFDCSKYSVYHLTDINIRECVKFKTYNDAQKICDILNENKFNIGSVDTAGIDKKKGVSCD